MILQSQANYGQQLDYDRGQLLAELDSLRAQVSTLTKELGVAADCVISLKQRAEAAESRISDLTKEKDSALQERDNLVQKYNAVYVRLEKEVKHPNTGMMPLSAELIDLAQWIVKRAEAAESERDRYKERVGVLEEVLRNLTFKCRKRGWLVAQDGECRELVKLAESALTPDSTRKENVSR